MKGGGRLLSQVRLPFVRRPVRLPRGLGLRPGGVWAVLALAVCVPWWLYLAASSQMVLQWDAAEYNALGEMLARQGWHTFLATGPHREPLYPLLVALAWRLGELFAFPYQKVLVALQFGLVALTQLLLLRLAAAMGVGKRVAVAAAVYVGVSPAIVNSACSMFSEVLAYPFVLAATLLTARAWAAQERGEVGKSVGLGLATGLVLAAGAFTKGVLAYVSLLVAVCVGVRGIVGWRRRRGGAAAAALGFAVAVVVVVAAFDFSYRDLNRRYNGNFEFTTRYLGLLYGNAAKRAMPLTARQYLAHVAAIPGGTVCQLLFTEEECAFCEFGIADELWLTELPRRLAGVPPGQQRAATLRLVREKVLQAPVAYTFLGITQVLRMPFWESTQLGYVTYPRWLARLYAAPVARYGVRLALGLLTLAALLRAAARLARSRWRDESPRELPSTAAARGAVLLVAVAFMTLYLPFSTLTRYALPIAPLYLLLIADMLDAARGGRRGQGGSALPHP